MPYATNGKISTSPIDGGIEITDAQYCEALEGIAAGKQVSIDVGFALVDPPKPAEPVASEPEVEPSGPPTVVTMRQARRALLDAGLLAAVDDAIAQLPGVEGDAARIDWEFAATVERASPLIASLSEALGLDEAVLDALFAAAGQIR